MADATNYDETCVPEYTLPDPGKFADGTPVESPGDWPARRVELLDLFTDHVYGRTPTDPVDIDLTAAPDEPVFEGLGLRRQVSMRFARGGHAVTTDLLLYLPAHADGPATTFCALNFRGNHTATADEGVRIEPRCADFERNRDGSRWPVEALLAEGFAIAMMCRLTVVPDNAAEYRQGVLGLFGPVDGSMPGDTEMGAVGGWAWTLCRMLDYLREQPEVDAERVIALGHSRLGKAALWAAAQDTRFAAAISNGSGCVGAALSRRCFGETVRAINDRFPYWFCGNFKQYNDREDELPVDQHELLALITPRPIHVASATDDLWADPRGEFLSLVHATPIYEWLGERGLPTDVMPAPDQPIIGHLAYHLRTGQHQLSYYDWEQYRRFASQVIRGTE